MFSMIFKFTFEGVDARCIDVCGVGSCFTRLDRRPETEFQDLRLLPLRTSTPFKECSVHLFKSLDECLDKVSSRTTSVKREII